MLLAGPEHAQGQGTARESMSNLTTAQIVRRFSQALLEHDPSVRPNLVAKDCVTESIQPAPDGTRQRVQREK